MRFFILLSLLIFGNTWAMENLHSNPSSQISMSSQNEVKDLKYPGYCQIEIVNNSHYTVRVFGIFDDDEELEPFRIYPHEYPHYISLYYYDYCHYGMNLYIETLGGYRVYSGYTRRYDTIYISSYMYENSPKISVKLDSKQNATAQ